MNSSQMQRIQRIPTEEQEKMIRDEVDQLRKEAPKERQMTSFCTKSLLEYCQEHQMTDYLVTKQVPIETGRNPFEEKKSCGLL